MILFGLLCVAVYVSLWVWTDINNRKYQDRAERASQENWDRNHQHNEGHKYGEILKEVCWDAQRAYANSPKGVELLEKGIKLQIEIMELQLKEAKESAATKAKAEKERDVMMKRLRATEIKAQLRRAQDPAAKPKKKTVVI